MNEIERFKKIIKGLRGKRSQNDMNTLCNMPKGGTWGGLETYGNPTLLTLLKLSKNLEINFELKNGKLIIK